MSLLETNYYKTGNFEKLIYISPLETQVYYEFFRNASFFYEFFRNASFL